MFDVYLMDYIYLSLEKYSKLICYRYNNLISKFNLNLYYFDLYFFFQVMIKYLYDIFSIEIEVLRFKIEMCLIISKKFIV